ncbi:MAG: aminotransferase, partial [Gammaproteobacteria bacterium]|nr:aminotransferase [Gammaproteobacteria bacterium]
MAWNSRVDHVAPFRVMHLLEMAQAREAAGHDVIHLEVGEPDFATPAPIIAAGQQALANGHTRYTPAAGLP